MFDVTLGNKKIAIIIPVDDDQMLSECMYYISRLIVPEGYELSVIEIREAVSMTSAYNEGMNSTDAKYKIYMHQDVFLLNQNIICELIREFTADEKLGMIGVIGGTTLPENAHCYDAWDTGVVLSNDVYHTLVNRLGVSEKLTPVTAIDGMFIATQYDIPWREDILKKWDFYDISQSLEFVRNGYKVGVLRQNEVWAMHDCGHSNLKDYDKERAIILGEYDDFFSGESEHQVEGVDPNEVLVSEQIIDNAIKYYDMALDDIYELVNEGDNLAYQNTTLSRLKSLYDMRKTDLAINGKWILGGNDTSYENDLRKYMELRFLIMRVELTGADPSVLNQCIEQGFASRESMEYIIRQTAVRPEQLIYVLH